MLHAPRLAGSHKILFRRFRNSFHNHIVTFRKLLEVVVLGRNHNLVDALDLAFGPRIASFRIKVDRRVCRYSVPETNIRGNKLLQRSRSLPL